MQLPGGPEAIDDVFSESWQYVGSARREGGVRHESRHRAHPNYASARVYAHVATTTPVPGSAAWWPTVASCRCRPSPGRRAVTPKRRWKILPVRERRPGIPRTQVATSRSTG